MFAENDSAREQAVWQKRQELEKLAENTAQNLRRLEEIEEKLSVNKGERNMKNLVGFNSEFVNDERVIGRWEGVAVVKKKEDFYSVKEQIGNEVYFHDTYFVPDGDDSYIREIYFLPDGGDYWIFSWTKGYLKISSGDGKTIHPYEIEEIDSAAYMFIETDSDEILVFKQTDKKRYDKYEIGQHDNIDLPFVNDENVFGKWTVVDYVKEISDFKPLIKKFKGELFFKSAEFLPDSDLRGSTSSGSFTQKWTKGTALFRMGSGNTASAYEIREYNGVDYLFMEFKSGDYTWGNCNPKYYVFTRDS
jgi:hypothetical protein